MKFELSNHGEGFFCWCSTSGTLRDRYKVQCSLYLFCRTVSAVEIAQGTMSCKNEFQGGLVFVEDLQIVKAMPLSRKKLKWTPLIGGADKS